MMTLGRTSLAGLLVIGLLSTGCDSEPPTAPDTTLTGTWRGLATDERGTATLEMVLTDADSVLGGRTITGTWSWTFPPAGANDRGCVFGTEDAGRFQLSLLVTPGACSVPSSGTTSTVTVTAEVEGGRLVGDYTQTFLASPATQHGRIDVTRR